MTTAMTVIIVVVTSVSALRSEKSSRSRCRQLLNGPIRGDIDFCGLQKLRAIHCTLHASLEKKTLVFSGNLFQIRDSTCD